MTGDNDSEGEGGSNVRGIVAAILLIAALLAIGLWLTGTLRSTSSIQDCVASGRTNCAPIR